MILIAFADELKSTDADEKAYKDGGAGENAASLKRYQSSVAKRRIEMFSNVLRHLINHSGTMVLKNIGDELVIVRKCDTATDVLGCIEALYIAWNQTQSIRVGAHVTRADEVATGNTLEKFQDKLRLAIDCDLPKLKKLWPSLALIHHDIFGAPMNRAARLKAFAHGAEFVLSEETAVAMAGAKDLIRLNPNRKAEAWKEAAERGIAAICTAMDAKATPVPLVRLKGITDVDIFDPWFAYQVEPASATTTSLALRAKEVHCIRLIEAWGAPIRPNDLDNASKWLQKTLFEAPSLKFFTDALFKITCAYRGHRPTFDRGAYEPIQGYERSDTSRQRRPAFLLITSISDHDSDEKLRSEIATKWKRARNSITLRPVSFPVYRSPTYYLPRNYTRDDAYVFVDFQVRSSAGIAPDDPKAVFRGAAKECANHMLSLFSCGLIEGLADGYFVAKANVSSGFSIADFCNDLVGLEPQPSVSPGEHFLTRVAPMNIYEMVPLSNVGGDYLNWKHRRTANGC